MYAKTATHLFPANFVPWIAALLVVVFLAATLEGGVITYVYQRDYDWRAYLATMGDVIARRVIDAMGFSIAAPVLAFAFTHRITTVDLAAPWPILSLFVGQEFFYYWYHRSAHKVRWFWATHSVHHSPNELTLAAALRLGWTGKLTGTSIFFAPLVWLGFTPNTVVAVLGVNLLYQFWLHAPWIPKLGPLEWIMNTPAHHRVHHASNAEYLDCNFGGVLIVFDRLFGTFKLERQDIVIQYGLTERIDSYNPLRIALAEWAKLGSDFWAAKCWSERLASLFGRPRSRK